MAKTPAGCLVGVWLWGVSALANLSDARSRRCSEVTLPKTDLAPSPPSPPSSPSATDQLDNDIGEEEGGRERRLQRALDMRHVHAKTSERRPQ